MGNIGSYVKNLINIYIFGTIIQLLEYHLEKKNKTKKYLECTIYCFINSLNLETF